MSKRVNEKDLFDFSGGEIPSQLPMLTEQEKNRMYKKSERKFSDDTGEIPVKEGNTVSGVERYSRPVWKRRLASVAAAGVLLAGSGGLGYYIKNGTLDGFESATVSDMTSTSDEADHQETAEYLINGYADFLTRFDYPASDENTIVKLNVEGEDIQIARYSDRSINSMADFRELGAKYMTDEYLNNNFDFSEAPDKSGFAEGSSIGADEWYAGNANARFFMYNGELYTYFNEDYSDGSCRWECKDISVIENGADSFKAKALLELYEKKGKKHSETEYEFEVVRSESANEWRINNARPSESSVQERETAYDQIALAKSCSDRYVQLQDYYYTRPCSEDDSVTFTIQKNGRDAGRQYYKIEDDFTNTENEFWNAHTIEEIRNISQMDFSLFCQLYGNDCFYKVDDSANEGDIVSFDGNDPVFIEYKGAMYTQGRNEDREMIYQYQADRLLLPFTDEPEIVSSDPLEIVFRRKTGHRSNYAEINQIPTTYEFKLRRNEEDEWHLTSVEIIENESYQSNETENTDSPPTELYFETMTHVYNYAVNALMSYEHLDLDRTISYYANISGKTELQADFAPFTHPDNITPKGIDDMLNEIFTKQYREKITSPYYQALKSKPYVDKDFGEYPDGYKWENPTDDELRNSPFVSMFIYRDGELYRNTNRTLAWLPFYPLNAQFEVQSLQESGGKYIVEAKCRSNYQGIDSGIVPSTTRLSLTFVNEDGSWKIDEVGAIEE